MKAKKYFTQAQIVGLFQKEYLRIQDALFILETEFYHHQNTPDSPGYLALAEKVYSLQGELRLAQNLLERAENA